MQIGRGDPRGNGTKPSNLGVTWSELKVK